MHPIAEGEALLSAHVLGAERAYRQLFKNIHFSVSAGEVLRIAGPNGAGKSTLLKVLAGISSDFEGDILWRGLPVDSVRDDFQRETCFLGHNKAVKLGLTAYENLAWFQSLYPTKKVLSITDALSQAGLGKYQHTLCAQLSAGQQQRVALARLLLSSANLWILDEPFTAIDKHGVSEFENIIGHFVQGGGAVIITTHHNLQLPLSVNTLDLGDL